MSRRSDLVAALQTVERAVSTRQTIPVLGGVLLTAEGGQLRLYATDLELAVECAIPAQVEEAGAAVVEARYLHQVVRRLEEGEVIIEKAADSGVVNVMAPGSRLSLQYQPADDFPRLAEVEEGTSFNIRRSTLLSMIRATLFAAATDPGRPFLTGVLFEVEPEEIRLVATDGNRLAFRRHVWIDGEKPPLAPWKAIVPGRSLGELMRGAGSIPVPQRDAGDDAGDEEDHEVKVEADRKEISFTWPNYRLTTRLIEGQFPNYRPVIPAQQRLSIVVPRDPFLAALERTAVLSRTGTAFTTLTLENGILRLRSREAEVGEIDEQIPVHYEEAPFETAYQARFLTEALRVLDTENVVLGLEASLSPGTIRPQLEPGQSGNDQYVYVMMPIRLG